MVLEVTTLLFFIFFFQRRNPHVALITAVRQHPSLAMGMGRSVHKKREHPGQRGQSPRKTTHPTAPSPWTSKDGGAPWGTVDWTFLPVGAARLGRGCSWHGFAAAKLYVAIGDGLVWSHPSTASAVPAELSEGS